ncbi:MAG: mannose-phosphate guanylyltransferase / phosphomannomutase [Patescibacteria group bacterium]|jgi:mannose-1-phosphate guanylyltransferase|nr:mannose-phosphate guanylyltransferase / phosphomannomutase [Patescibacteria group bacterium]
MKTRLTITLPPDLLKTIDAFVDKKTIRNRSHAIEHLVRASISSQINTAVILAGGNKKSKQNPLLKKIDDKELFIHQVSHLKQYGIKTVIVCLNESDKYIETIFGDGKDLGVRILYSFESITLGTAGTLKKASKLWSNQSAIVVLHGDVLTTIALDELIAFHQSEEADITLAVKPRIGKRELGQVYLQGSRVTSFTKNSVESEISIINTGVYIISPSVLETLSTKTATYLETDVFPKLADDNKLRAFIFQGIWYDISTDEQHLLAQKRLS